MDNRTWKEVYILLILIVACIMIFSQCDCFQCKCKCKCKERNRINISQPQSSVMVRATPVQIKDNIIVVIGEPFYAFDMEREIPIQVEPYIIE